MRYPFTTALAASFFCLSLGATTGHAAALRVDRFAAGPTQDGATWQSAYRSVQGALNAARSGDEVWVRNTTFFEDLIVATPSVTMIGGFAGSETTNAPTGGTSSTLTGSGASVPVVTVSPTGNDFSIRGFQIIGSPRLGFWLMGHGVRVSDCVIKSNGTSGLDGGGIVCEPGSSVTISDCTITRNLARSGAGIRATAASITVTHSVITENAASYTHTNQPGGAVAEGGGVFLDGGEAVIKNSLITGNTVYALEAGGTTAPSVGRGGGLALHGKATVTNNVIAFNKVLRPVSADNAIGGGGGAYLDGEGAFGNNIMAYNAVEGDTGAAHGGLAANTEMNVSHNLFHANEPDGSGDYVGIGGNLSGDPLFAAGAPYDFRPRPGSPAIDAGDDTLVDPGDMDWAGRPRSQGPHVDIGVYEAEPAPPVLPPRLYVRSDGSDSADGESWQTAKATILAAVSAVAADGEIWVAHGTYTGQFTLGGSKRLLGGFQGVETSSDRRDRFANRTILQGDGIGPVVYVPLNATGVVVDGFTIRDGGFRGVVQDFLRDAWGGAIASWGANTVIGNNTIEENHIRLSSENPAGYGAGIAIGAGSATIRNNIIRGNTVETTRLVTFPQFPNRTDAFGGGLYLVAARVEVYNNLIMDNSVAATDPKTGEEKPYGSGIHAVGVTGLIANNTLVANVASPVGESYPGAEGGAFYLRNVSDGLTVANNIVAFNSSGIVIRNSTAGFHNNDSFGHAMDYDATPAETPTAANGNVSKNPRFVNRPGGNYLLSPASPAIDAGNNAYARGSKDLAGVPRISGAAVDMGALEFVAFPDALRALRIVGGLDAAPPYLLALDTDVNEKVDIRDALALLRYAAR